MSFENKRKLLQKERQIPSSSINSDQLYIMLREMGDVINSQAEALKKFGHRLGESSFRMGKIEEQLQILRIGLRIQKDKMNTMLKTLTELGIVDDTVFNIIYGIVENKSLPITSEDRINARITLSRYNTPATMIPPENAI